MPRAVCVKDKVILYLVKCFATLYFNVFDKVQVICLVFFFWQWCLVIVPGSFLISRTKLGPSG